MSDKSQNEDEMGRLDDRTQEFKERITTLKELITMMVAEEKETKRQSELLLEMLRVLKAVKAFEAEALNAFTAYDSHTRINSPKKS